MLLIMIRPGAAFIAAPFFNATQIPVQLRVTLALAIGLPALSLVGDILPPDGLLSVMGLVMVMTEIILGLAIGFTLQIAYSSSLLAGELISSGMGLSFAAAVDPTSGQSNPVIANFISVLATLLLLASNGHLVLMQTLYESYRAMPPGQAWLGFGQIDALVGFGGALFSMGFAIALPIIASITLVQILLGIVSRSAPQFNLFSVSLPATTFLGILFMVLFLPSMASGIDDALERGLSQARALILAPVE